MAVNNLRVPRFAADGSHTRDCFCSHNCRVESLQAVLSENIDEEQLFREYYQIIPKQINDLEDRLFNKTKRLILYGNVHRIQALAGTRFTSYGAWLAWAPQHRNMSKPDKEERCQKMTWAKKVLEDWDTIVINMSNPLLVHINIKRFTVQQLYRARCPKWCKKENRRQDPNSVTETVVPNFDIHKIDTIARCIEETGIVNDVSGEDDQLKLISNMLLQRMKNINH